MSESGEDVIVEAEVVEGMNLKKAALPVFVVLMLILAAMWAYSPDDGDSKGRKLPTHGIRSPQVIEHWMEYHIVLVGFEDGVIDEQVMIDRLPTEYRPVDTIRSAINGFPRFHEPQLMHYNFTFHTAPDEFAQDLFNYADSVSEWGDLGDEGRVHMDEENYEYLKEYDTRPLHAHHNRIVVDENVQFIDAVKLEQWIDSNRSNYGLEFESNSYTYFLIDSWTRMESDFGNVLPVDKYHYYKFYEADWIRRGVHTMRSWGGDYGFLWLDVGAAPNFYEVVDDDLMWGSADDDPPIWDIGNPVPAYAPGTFNVDDFNDNNARDLHYALNFRFSPSYIYHPEFADEYYINAHVYYEQGVVQDARIELDFEDMMNRLNQSFPWCTINGEVHIYDLPNDDHGMYNALEQGKEDGGYTYVNAQPVIRQVETNRDQYYLGPKEAFNIFAGFVQFEDSHYTFAAPVAPQGVAMNSPDGTPWGVLQSNNEFHRRTEDWDAPGEGVFPWTSTGAHECGHFWGLHHPHDGYIRSHGTDGTDGDYRSAQHWLWDQSATIMSYRTHTYRCDGLDMDQIARGHIMENTNDARRNVDIVYEMLLSKGRNAISGQWYQDSERVLGLIDEAIDMYQDGLYQPGVLPSWEALNLSKDLMWRVSDKLDVDLRAERVDLEWDGSSDGAFRDYQPIDITTDMEYLNLTVYWNNTGGTADLYAGYTFTDGTNGARYNYYIQEAGEMDCVEHIQIDLDDDGIRDAGELFVGTGSTDDGDNVPYHVVVTTIYRESGTYWKENGLSSF